MASAVRSAISMIARVAFWVLFRGIRQALYVSGLKSYWFNSFPCTDTPAKYVKMNDGVEVVQDRDLQLYLETDLPRRAVALHLKQSPDVQITSPDATYLGRVTRSAHAQNELAAPPSVTAQRFAAKILRSTLDQTKLDLDELSLQFGSASGYFETHDTILNSTPAANTFGAPTGVVVVGNGVVRVAVTAGASATISREPPQSGATFVIVETGDTRNVSVLLEFDDGSGTVIAALRNFVGVVTVADGVVVGVNYTSSAKGARGLADERSRLKFEQLRADAAAAGRLRAFRLDSAEDVGRFAEAIRVGEGLDPTLSVYAVYAYEQACRFEVMQSIAVRMSDDLGQILFDVALLAGRQPVNTVEPSGIVTPFCPLLTQGWNYLSATNATIPKVVLDAGGFLRPALWTIFDPKGVDTLLASSLFEVRSP